jgi:hypothetical protein
MVQMVIIYLTTTWLLSQRSPVNVGMGHCFTPGRMFEQLIAIASLSNAREPQVCRTVDCRGKEDIVAAGGRQKEANQLSVRSHVSKFKWVEKLACFDRLELLKHAS